MWVTLCIIIFLVCFIIAGFLLIRYLNGDNWTFLFFAFVFIVFGCVFFTLMLKNLSENGNNVVWGNKTTITTTIVNGIVVKTDTINEKVVVKKYY